MRVLIAGASGLVGRALVANWSTQGHQVIQLVRRRPEGSAELFWDPGNGRLEPAALEGFDAAVCLSGAGILDARWNSSRKEDLRSSRILPAELFARTLAQRAAKPKCLICASAAGIYGMNRGDELLTEQSSRGADFIASLCTAWEGAVEPACRAGIRVVNLRLGIVLNPAGGALAKMLPLFRLGLGGQIGTGHQYLSWVTLDDVVAIVEHIVKTDTLAGPINASAPNPVTNREFSSALGRALHRPALLRVPAFALRAVVGEMAGLLLGSLRVYPRALDASEFRFRDPEINLALARMLAISQP